MITLFFIFKVIPKLALFEYGLLVFIVKGLLIMAIIGLILIMIMLI